MSWDWSIYETVRYLLLAFSTSIIIVLSCYYFSEGNIVLDAIGNKKISMSQSIFTEGFFLLSEVFAFFNVVGECKILYQNSSTSALWHFGPDNSLLVGGCSVHCRILVASLASIHYMPVVPSPSEL